MSAVSPILRSVEFGEGRIGRSFWCPGCNQAHPIPTQGANAWGFNGNDAAPTFTPSILVRQGHYVSGHDGEQCYCNWDRKDQEEFADLKCGICHSFVTDGQIKFLGDCTHQLAGQTVPLPAFPIEESD